MKKRILITLLAAISVTSLLPAAVRTVPGASAATAAASIKFANGVYLGEVKNGLPHGKGKLTWSNNKWYMGDFVQGKRSGAGKYYNEYISEDGRTHRTVYNGAWKNDQMSGTGTLTDKVTEPTGEVVSNAITTGEFGSNVWKSGYQVMHAVADPDYSFMYKGNGTTISIWGTNGSLLQQWKEGNLFRVQYQKGQVYKEYWIFPTETAAEEKAKQASIRYLKNIASQAAPHLAKFEQLAKQVPLK